VARVSLFDVFEFVPDLRPFLADPSITEIMVNGSQVFVERNGHVQAVPDLVIDENLLRAEITRLASDNDDKVNDRQPILDARLDDGSRIAAMLPPASVGGPILTIRKFTQRFTLRELHDNGTLIGGSHVVLIDAVFRYKNILISGAAGTGKTTLLNAIGDCIADKDRIAIIEDTAEIYLQKPNLIRLEAQREIDDRKAITIATLVRAVLRHRPDRIIVGEVRGAEAFDLLQALNTGHRGSLTTIHANSAASALTRLAHCVLMAKPDIPYENVHEAIGEAIDIVVHLQRQNGRRLVTEVVQVERYNIATHQYEFGSEMVTT
jgi:pilus assembly protein CpaF